MFKLATGLLLGSMATIVAIAITFVEIDHRNLYDLKEIVDKM